jgi:6-phosphofructo-2-kinase/fructose-2,6-biphosphatase 2
MYSVPGTPHFGAQTDMLKTLDESTKVIKRSQAAASGGAGGGLLGLAGGGAATPSVSGIGTLLDRPDYSEAKIVVAMVGLPARGKSYLSNRLLRYLRVSLGSCLVHPVAEVAHGAVELVTS